jgi:hypothetical protein
MRKPLVTILVLAVLLVGCGPDPIPGQVPGPTFPPPTAAPTTPAAVSPTTTEPEPSASTLLVDRQVDPPGLPQDATELVSASGNCSACHTGLTGSAGEDLSFDTLWRSSMMAHSARDPYWQATVSTETVEFPELAEVIASKCAGCHMPLASLDAHANGITVLVLEDGFLNPANPLHDLAMDGGSCTGCHQILPDNLGLKTSFSGGYLIDTLNRGFGERVTYGPLPVTEANAQLMQQASGYLPIEAAHSAEAALCGTCHNLYTPFLDSAGEIAGEFPEQMVYSEWLNSDFARGSCTDCHMPQVEDVQIATVAAEPQAYLRKHTFTGANAFMLTLLNDNAADTGITATDEQMAAAIQRTQDQFSVNEDNSLQILEVTEIDDQLEITLLVSNPNGHKRPTSFPSRRIWIHLQVTDPAGNLVFESGVVDDTGMIAGNDNDLDPALFEPHYDLITSPDQVQIYESIMANTEGEVTTTLLRAAAYLKDNRLLPAGFPLADPDPDIAVYGEALADPNFLPGSDTVTYQIDISESPGPYTVTATLYYQSIGYRWAENLRGYQTEQTAAFFGYYDVSDRTPIVLGSIELNKE